MTMKEWVERLDEFGVWFTIVQRDFHVVNDPQARAAGAFVTVPDSQVETRDGTVVKKPVESVAGPVDFEGVDLTPRSGTPTRGQHTEEVLKALGYDDEAIARMLAAAAS